MSVLTVEQARAATFRVTMHLDADDHAMTVWQSPEIPGLHVIDRTPRGRRSPKLRMGRVYVVDHIDGDFTDLAAAVAAWNRMQEEW